MKRISSGVGRLEGAEYPITCDFTLAKGDAGTMELYCKFSPGDQKDIPYSKKISNALRSPLTRFEGKSMDGKSLSIESLQLTRSTFSNGVQRMWFLAEKVND